jgi:hypothetical protein
MACASRTPPQPPIPRAPTTVWASLDGTWDAVIDVFAARNIPIRTIERVSGLIVTDPLTIAGDDGRDWADCGKVNGRVILPDNATYNVLVRGDSVTSTVQTTVRWTRWLEGAPSPVECSTTHVWERDFEEQIKRRAEGRSIVMGSASDTEPVAPADTMNGRAPDAAPRLTPDSATMAARDSAPRAPGDSMPEQAPDSLSRVAPDSVPREARDSAPGFGRDTTPKADGEPPRNPTPTASADSTPDAPVPRVRYRQPREPRAGSPRSSAELLRTPDFNLAVTDCLRLGLIVSYDEVARDTLVVELTESAMTSSSTEYNLERLFDGYQRANFGRSASNLQLRYLGAKVGEYTRTGLRRTNWR